MRLCTKCHQITTGKPLFCNKCGSSYNVRLCSRLHVNPRAAKICSQCGSKDSSAERLSSFPPLCFAAWPWTGISVPGCCRTLSRVLHPQTRYRSKRSSASDVHWIPAWCCLASLDDAAEGTPRTIRRNCKTDLQEKGQGRITQALKEEER